MKHVDANKNPRVYKKKLFQVIEWQSKHDFFYSVFLSRTRFNSINNFNNDLPLLSNDHKYRIIAFYLSQLLGPFGGPETKFTKSSSGSCCCCCCFFSSFARHDKVRHGAALVHVMINWNLITNLPITSRLATISHLSVSHVHIPYIVHYLYWPLIYLLHGHRLYYRLRAITETMSLMRCFTLDSCLFRAQEKCSHQHEAIR